MAHTALRLSGLALIIGSVIFGVALVLALSPRAAMNAPMSLPTNVLLFLAGVFLLLSLPGMYAKHADAAGWLGLIGHALLQTGVLLLVVVSAPALLFPSFNLPIEDNLTAALLGLALPLGLLLTGIATLRAGVYPRLAGIFLLAAMAGFFFSFWIAEFLPVPAGQVSSTILTALLPLSLAWFGLLLLRSPRPAG